jgi:acyl dehydratase
MNVPRVDHEHYRSLSFTQAQFDAFAILSRDTNPIHTSPDFSARTSFGRTVAHGMLLYGSVIRELGEFLPPFVQLYQEMMFPSPTFTEESLEVRLKILELNEKENIAKIETNLLKPDGTNGFQGHTLVYLLDRINSSSYPVIESGIGEYEPSTITHRGLSIGQNDEVSSSINLNDLDDYQAIFNDSNSLFTDPEFARKYGFKECLVPGSLIGGLFSYQLGIRLPGKGTNWLKQKLRFLRPLYPKQEIITRVEVIRIRPEKDLVNLSTVGRTSQGDVLVEGEALVRVQDLEKV